MGHDREAKRVLMAQQDDRRRRVLRIGDARGSEGRRRWSSRLRGWGAGFMKLTTGYGYEPWRTVACLFVLIMVSCGAAFFMGNSSCGILYRIVQGLSWALPVIFHADPASCVVAQGSMLLLSWIFTILGWVMLTLLVAGLTGLIRRN